METLYANQSEIYEAINKLGINIRKDGVERKKGDYFKRKLELLESYWEDFENNHKSICGLKVTDHPYFDDSLYKRTHGLYVSTKNLIHQQYQAMSSKGMDPPASARTQEQAEEQEQDKEQDQVETMRSKYANTDPSTSTAMVTRGLNSKVDDMLRKQAINFKALMRTINNIDLEAIDEKWELEDTLKSLQVRWTAIDTLHWDLQLELNGDDEEYELVYTRHEQKYNAMKRTINKHLWSVGHREKSVPQMEIPVFSGSYNQWTSFKDLFDEAIHKNPSLSNAQKMQFLKGKVRGEAERLIQHLTISSENYHTCIEILNNRYNNKKLIFSSHINMLLGLQVIQQQNLVQIKRMHDVTVETLHAIRNLGVDISTWDPILVHILCQKLDQESYSDYVESLKNPRELPVFSDFIKFLESKFTCLETSRRKQDNSIQKSSQNINSNQHNFNKQPSYKNYNNSANKSFAKALHVSASIKCPHCNEEHGLYSCKKFLEMPNDLKLKTVSKLKVCINCLFDHSGKQCISSRRCRVCNGKHNTLLHDACSSNLPTKGATIANKNEHVNNKNSHVSQNGTSEVLLATAMVKIRSLDGTYQTFRALIDQGSQISLISENAAQQLNIKRKRCKGVVYGLGERENNCKGVINMTCMSMYNDFSLNIDAFIMKQLVKNLPSRTFPNPSWDHLKNIDLADPEFYVSRPIDLLLGSDVYASIKMAGICRGEDNSQPLAEQTQLGWILFGKMMSYQCNVVINDVEKIQKYWEIEDINEQSTISSEEQTCIDFYDSTTERREDGRYVVRLPLKPDIEEKLGSSKEKAVGQFMNLKKKFERQSQLAEQYKSFVSEYIALDHMKLSDNNNKQILACYLPHHAVQRAEATTTKLRVVFNASAKTSSGHSLNDLMFKGPNLQQDLQALIIKWRLYRYAYASDIEKMYRQIVVHEADQSLQQIVWRNEPEQPIQSFQLATVTYGTKAAPFLARMTLRRLAVDEQHNYPEASKILQEAFYVDDHLNGCHSIKEGMQLIADISNLLQAGGFYLRKWTSNEPKLLQNLPGNESKEQVVLNFKSETPSKTLGLLWNPLEDNFGFKCNLSKPDIKPTKRAILSEISKVYDPLGWLSPLSTTLKLLFQQIWTANLEWDEIIPDSINKQWKMIRDDIENISSINIPRWIGFQVGTKIELVGFCDSSQKSYAGVVYARIVREDQVSVVLVAAKTRLVPVNKTVSLPRLELCGALLLSKLMEKIVLCIGENNVTIYGWTDSMVVLSWLQGEPGRWKPFVANRVQKITKVIHPNSWYYVKSEENPADSASRGISASQLKTEKLWWQGPEWMKAKELPLHGKQKIYSTDEEVRGKQVHAVQSSCDESIIKKLLEKHNSFIKVAKIIAWMIRAIKTITFRDNASKGKQWPGYITLPELKVAKLLIIKYVQRCEFSMDIDYIRRFNTPSNKSNLLKLNPFLDKQGILRVGGRLKNTHISNDMKYPMIIPNKHRLTSLLIDEAHQLTYHGGANLTLANLRQKYWIVTGMRTVKNQLTRCVTCRKHNPKQQYQLMGNLPEERCNPAQPFFHTGVDYTGFVEIKANKGRGIKTTKGYVAVFICMVTKAIHLELVSDLSSSAFLAALRRMAARKGAPAHAYSDNGSNFIGANRILKQEYYDLRNVLDDNALAEITDLNIEWHFNAPSWPSAGGLWERSVKSVKHHLKRVIGEQKLTFEEFSTILAQTEACLNSRPLSAMSEDPDSLDFLTPAHFLTGRPGNIIIETEHDARTRWQLTFKLAQDIWKRWKTEHLTQLSVRSKWLKQQDNVKVGDLVTIHDDNLPPGKWMMGRILELHPGQDGLVRVVSLKTKNGIIKRPVVKLSVLPLSIKESAADQREEADDSDNSPPKSTSKRTRPKFLSLALSFIFFMTIICGSHGSYNITNLNEHNGLYFDRIGNMQLVRDEWKLVTFYDLNPFWNGITALSKNLQYLEKICNIIKIPSHCEIIVSQLRHGFSEVEYSNRILLSQHLNARARRRRGLINGIGYLANDLFGVLDERFAKQYQNDIAHIKKDQNHLAALWKNQTSIIEAQNNLLIRMQGIIQGQNKAINLHLSNLNNSTNLLRTEMWDIELENEFTLSTIISNNLLSSLRTIQNTLVDMITDIHHGMFNVHLLSPKQLQNELNIISGLLSRDLLLSVENIQLNMPQIYKVLKVKTRMTKEYLIFEIRIPLISRDVYELYHLIAIPQQVKNTSVSVIPISNYVAINLQKDIYLPMQQFEIQQCIEMSTTYQCNLHTTIYHLKSNQNLCVTDLKTHKCKMSFDTCVNKWLQLNQINTYMYYCCHECALRFMCEDRVTVEQLTAAGLIHLGHKCVIKGSDFTTYAQNEQSNIVKINSNNYVPQIAPINHIINISLTHYDFDQSADSEINETLGKIASQISNIKAIEIPEENYSTISSHDIHQYAISYVLIAAAVSAAAAFLWRACRKRRVSRASRGAEVAREPSPSDSDNVQCVSANVLPSSSNRASAVPPNPNRKKNQASSPIPMKVFTISDLE